MAGIAGVDRLGKEKQVREMLNKIAHRGGYGVKVREKRNTTLGIVYPKVQKKNAKRLKKGIAADEVEEDHSAVAKAANGGLTLKRDSLGVAPLYYGRGENGELYFASEVKALLGFCKNIKQVPYGSKFDGEKVKKYFKIEEKEPLEKKSDEIAHNLKEKLICSIKKRIDLGGKVGAWLSGGLDSSTMSALAKKYCDDLQTFAAGVKGAPDLEFAREVAHFIGSDHREIVLDFNDLIKVLPKVIYHLESFDALLIRSTITNYMVAEKSSDHVEAVFSGEGGDELFAGYEYLKGIDEEKLDKELMDIIGRLHNTALQRVDRSASAHGTIAHIGFLDPEVVEYAMKIPVKYKIRNGVEKWILRKAMEGELPERVLTREKAKFWQGAGVTEMISDYAEKKITDEDFQRERKLKNGWILNSKEELLYYRYFKEYFGELEDFSWMGRTKDAPEV
ncbi:MAG TPA: asparagine synthase-related protein [Acidobacteriota bacterium]|nr:asparagine synthase-related protein [Acidobacteriota bacterium]